MDGKRDNGKLEAEQYLDGFLRRIREVGVKEEWAPLQVEYWRGLLGAAGLDFAELLHRALEIPLSDKAPRTDIVAEDLSAEN